MNDTKMPVIFSGHGSPMVALEDNEITRGMRLIGDTVIDRFGTPKAILAVSGHWYTRGTFVQKTDAPKQVYDMYGFPEALYQVKYPTKGCAELSDRVLALLDGAASVNNEWGIDHGTWTVLVHMFPQADIPVVQLSIDSTAARVAHYELGRKLAALRMEGCLIFASGNIVHNLRRVEWDNPNGTEMTLAFNDYVIDKLKSREDEAVIQYERGPHAEYAVPTPDHFLPLLYAMGASAGEKPLVFNNICNLGSMAMTGFAFGLELPSAE